MFGSDELAGYSPPVAERAPAPYLVLSREDAKTLGVAPGDGVRILELDASVAVRIHADIPAGVVALAQGLPGAPLLAGASVRLAPDPGFVADASPIIAKG